MDTGISYAGILRRALAYVIDSVLWTIIALILVFSLFQLPSSLDNIEEFYHTITTRIMILAEVFLIIYLAFNVFMIMKYGGTPGKLLCSIYVKDANTLKNVTTAQATIRCVLSGVLWCMLSSPKAFGLVSILPILVILFAIFDQRKQTIYDKIAKTVVIDYKPEN
ncbi:RDD family protein [Wolbachia pipientis]|uniref:RDD family protein n=1 Tax=Wolbachia pipientis TaxID=955 RepID=UPI00202FD80B|nr:RDD family protein [Wolbachia pipientis]MCM1002640.1 RDD family protein [Wolbachia pipientis]